MPAYYVWTIGCQMNRAESERLAARFDASGYSPAPAPAAADLIVLNTCVVRQSAEDKVINKLHEIKRLKKARPELKVAVTGCIVAGDNQRLRKLFPFIDYYFAAGGEPPWLEMPAAPALPNRPTPSVYVTISQGCNNFCSYCIVPYRRGRERSRAMPDIVCEVKELVRRGALEIILLGQNVDSYGRDLPGKPDLADLLTELNGISGLARLRFLTNHPKDMSLKLIEAVAALDKVCEQVSLPVQAGSDAVLKAMKRGYTAAHFRDLAAAIRARIPGAAISTDVIVGFPGETEAQFMETFNLLSDLKFDTVHVAAYSPREGTAAARDLPDDVPPEVKKDRLARIESLQENVQAAGNARLAGQMLEILVEGRSNGKWYGRTRTDKLVFFHSPRDWTGKLAGVKIEKTTAWSLQGRVVTNRTNEEGR